MSQRIVIIAAGGTGSRLNANLPKQYMLLQDRPVLMHTIDVFAPVVDEIIVVLHPDMESYWKELCIAYNFQTTHRLVKGGKTRFQSVQNGLNHWKSKSPLNISRTVIAVHDAARPLVDVELVKQSFEMALEGKSNVLACASTNSIRIGSLENSVSTDRTTVWQIQTPQTFPANVLWEAFQQEESPLFTDDASVVEKIGYPIYLLESSPRNIKLTFPEDFEIANMYLKQ